MQLSIQDDVARLKISVHDLNLAQIFQGLNQLRCEVLDKWISHLLVLAQESMETALGAMLDQ